MVWKVTGKPDFVHLARRLNRLSARRGEEPNHVWTLMKNKFGQPIGVKKVMRGTVT